MSQKTEEATSSHSLFSEVLDALNDCTVLNDRDANEKRLIAEYTNFKPARSMELLLERFSSGGEGQSSTVFIEEMKTLLSWNDTLKNWRSNWETEEAKRKERRKLFRKTKGLTIPKQVADLEEKYGIQESGTATEVITYSRLRFLFPNLIGLTSRGYYGEKNFIPQMFGAPEFGGLIPSKDFRGKHAIISLHLYCLRLVDPKTSLRLHHLLLKKLIYEGLLSDQKRLRFLVAQGVAHPDGNMTDGFWDIYGHLFELYRKIDDDILQVEKINGFSLSQNYKTTGDRLVLNLVTFRKVRQFIN
nr:PREDICTED: uncharacterized protein LOC109035493 [Bemisia tabaci]